VYLITVCLYLYAHLLSWNKVKEIKREDEDVAKNKPKRVTVDGSDTEEEVILIMIVKKQ